MSFIFLIVVYIKSTQTIESLIYLYQFNQICPVPLLSIVHMTAVCCLLLFTYASFFHGPLSSSLLCLLRSVMLLLEVANLGFFICSNRKEEHKKSKKLPLHV